MTTDKPAPSQPPLQRRLLGTINPMKKGGATGGGRKIKIKLPWRATAPSAAPSAGPSDKENVEPGAVGLGEESAMDLDGGAGQKGQGEEAAAAMVIDEQQQEPPPPPPPQQQQQQQQRAPVLPALSEVTDHGADEHDAEVAEKRRQQQQHKEEQQQQKQQEQKQQQAQGAGEQEKEKGEGEGEGEGMIVKLKRKLNKSLKYIPKLDILVIRQVMEDRPIAAKHKEKDKAFQTCAKNVRAAAARDPDPLIQNRGRYVNRDNLQNRMKTLKKKHEDDDRRSLRSSGSAEEYTERQQQMNALVEAWNGADLAAAEGRALTAAQLKQRSLNGKSLQGALFAQAAKAQVLKKRGQAHAQQLGVWDYTIVKESTRRPTVTQRLEMADRALEEGRSSKDALGAYEDQFDKAISALEQAITADGTATKAQDERLAALENGTAGMNARMDELSGLLQRFMNMFATRGDSAKRKRE